MNALIAIFSGVNAGPAAYFFASDANPAVLAINVGAAVTCGILALIQTNNKKHLV